MLADRVLQHPLQRAVAAQQLGRGLRADALGAGQAVGGVAAQGDEVGDELGPDPVALLDLCRPNCFGPFAFTAGLDVEDRDPLVGALVHVAVAGHQQRPAAGLRLAAGVGAEQVVGLEVVAGRHGPAEGLEEIAGGGELGREVVGHRRLALGVVGGVELGPVGGGVGAEAEDDGARLVQLDLAQDQVGGAEQGVDRLAVAADDRVRQRVEGAEQHRGRVDCKQRAGHRLSLCRQAPLRCSFALDGKGKEQRSG